MRTDLVLDALRMALGQREPGADFALVHHTDRGSQYTSADYTQELDDHGVLASVGSVGDAYDNALAESFVDTFKTELIADRAWRSRSQLELASSSTSPGSTTTACTPHRRHPAGRVRAGHAEQAEPPPGSTPPTGSLRRAAGEHPEPLPGSVKLQPT